MKKNKVNLKKLNFKRQTLTNLNMNQVTGGKIYTLNSCPPPTKLNCPVVIKPDYSCKLEDACFTN